MKNTNLKLNKIKLVARLMLVVILVASITMLPSCFFIGGETSCIFTFYSHNEFAEFINKYMSNKQDRFVPTFVSFDLDDIDYLKVDKYSVGTSQNRSKNIPVRTAPFRHRSVEWSFCSRPPYRPSPSRKIYTKRGCGW